MAKRSVSHDKVLVDPIFSLPEGSEDEFSYSRENSDPEDGEILDDLSVEAFEYIPEGEIEYEDGYDDLDEETLEVPEGFTIISQSLRRAPGGQQVVDMVIETDTVANSIRYEIQVTKI